MALSINAQAAAAESIGSMWARGRDMVPPRWMQTACGVEEVGAENPTEGLSQRTLRAGVVRPSVEVMTITIFHNTN
jgi:hypothetical protein